MSRAGDSFGGGTAGLPRRVDDLNIGVFFTPPRWARWAVERYGVHRAWADGAVVLDPSAGEGALLEAVVQTALDEGLAVTGPMLARLHGVEVRPGLLDRLRARLQRRHGLSLPRRNLVQADYLQQDLDLQADLLLGNPPWINYVDLPADYKELTRPLFEQYGLVEGRRSVLLGASRVDLAALFLCRAMANNLGPGGRAVFFLPLALLLNDGAHDAFRAYRIRGTAFRLDEVNDFAGEPVFEGVSTRYGLAAFTRDEPPRFPVPYRTRDVAGRCWLDGEAAPPAQDERGPLLVTAAGQEPPSRRPLLAVPRRSQPRQGVNTCGANSVLVFEEHAPAAAGVVKVTRKDGVQVKLPAELIFPLIGKEQFAAQDAPPRRAVLLPHAPDTGQPLTEQQLSLHPLAREYLQRHREALGGRRGVLINSWIARGRWWALLGVGPYSFAPYKVVWQAYGKSTFRPRLFTTAGGRPWQANQAMHAFMPFWRREDAVDALAGLRDPAVEQILLSQRMAGTCNWAQPGRIKKLLQME